MDPDLADLVPLFVGEARGRIESLATLADRVESDPQALAGARRELHTLKGAGRMLRLTSLAELCHAAEGSLQGPRAASGTLLTRVVDALSRMVDAVAAGVDPTPDVAVLAALSSPAPSPQPGSMPETGGGAVVQPARPAEGAAAPSPTTGEVRIAAPAVDALADRATRVRILALAAERFPRRLHELSRLAERGTREEHPGHALAVMAASLRRLALELESGQEHLRRTAESQLEELLALQVQPLRGLFLTLSRHARELARSLGREVEVVTRGEETRLDRRIVRELEEALIHLLRNAVDHGIEPPDRRAAAGKSRAGMIRLEAISAGNRVRISIADDGAGVDPAAVATRAVERGIVDAGAARAMSRQDALRLLFTPEFSTRTDVSEVSGRGVGLDVVAAVVARVGGSVEIDATPGEGTTVRLDLPVALRGEVVMVVKVGSLRLALPGSVVRSVRSLRAADVVERGGRTLARDGDRLVAFVSLAAAFDEIPAAAQLLLEGTFNGQPLALSVDALLAEEEVLIRPLTALVPTNPLLEGVTLLASGEPVGVLSPLGLVQQDLLRVPRRSPATPPPRKLRVLLVDDSLVTREMERRLLEDAGFDVVTAGDAVQALTSLAEQPLDCVVTDIEMPGMDGMELTRRVRATPHLAQLPVVVVSTRDRPEDRLKGLEAGADAYLTKQGLDASELVTLVRRLGGR